MKNEGDSGGVDSLEEMLSLTRTLQETYRRLRELTGGEVDAVLDEGGNSYLLQEAQEKLRQSEEQFRNMFTAAAIGIAISTPQGQFLHVNAAYCQMLGYTENELLKLNFAALTHPEDLTLNLELRDELLAGQRNNFVLEKRYLKKNGDIVWTRHSVSATHAASGEITTLMVVAEDITQRKLAEEVLQQRQIELQVLFDLMPAMVWFKDTTNGVLRVNQRAAKVTGKPVKEIEGRSMTELYPHEAAKYYADDLEIIHSREPKMGIIETLRNAEGEARWVQTDKVPVCDKAGKVIGIVVMVQDITDRKEAEESLALFRTLVDRSPDAIEVIDPETGRFLDVNTTGCARLGYSREEMLSLKLADIDIEKDYRSLWPVVVEQIKKTGFASIIGRHRRKDGSTFPVEVNARYIELNRGYMIAVVRDITERLQAAKALEELSAKTERRERMLTMALSSMSDFAQIYDREGRFLFANQPLLKLWGLTLEEVVGKNFYDLGYPAELAAKLQRQLQEVFEDKMTIVDETSYTSPTGIAGQYEYIFSPALKPDGTADFVIGATRDITERKRNEARLRRLVDSNVQGVFFWNTKGEIFEANDALLGLVGHTREDLKAGRVSWARMTPPELAEKDQRALGELAAKGVCEPYEKEFIRKDGTRVPVLIGAAMFDDNPDDGVCFVVDLSERKKLEQQFLRAQRMESIGTLAGGVAHDLNNILAPIMMSIEILKSTTDTPQTREILATIEVSAKRGADIVRQVLSFARGLDGERVEVQPKHFLKDLEHIIKDTFPKNIQLRFAIPNDTWTILGDPTQVHQVLLNLCVNARDAMPEGGHLTIGVENAVVDEQYAAMNLQAKVGRYVKIGVTDSGTGMPQEIIDKIFDPFFTTKELNKGTGLGLSTVMAIVKSHGGIINVYSEVGKGTNFNVYLPAMENAVEVAKKQTLSISLPRGNGETILVVDDEAAILSITNRTLQAFGYRVLTAGDGAEALAVYAEKKNEIAVVLTDMMMPVMDGSSLIRVLTRMNPAIKIVAASGLSTNRSGNKSPGSDIKHFLTKPYTAETLLKTLRTILDEA